MRSSAIAKIVKRLIDEGKPHKIEKTLLEMRACHRVVAREWASEPTRRAALEARRERRRARHRPIGKKGNAYRRIIHTHIYPKPGSPMSLLYQGLHILPREHSFHATKGWRSNRAAQK